MSSLTMSVTELCAFMQSMVATGYHWKSQQVSLANPSRKKPTIETKFDSVDVYRFINAVMQGIGSYDTSLLVLDKK